jgi:carbon storage regulator CsrA
MLVLSRRAQQQISFPNLNITLSILQVRGQIVKVGIEAPPEVTIKRQEVLERSVEQAPSELFSPDPYADISAIPALEGSALLPSSPAPDATSSSDSQDKIEHWRRNQLNTLGLYLDAIQMRLDQGEADSAKEMLNTLISNLNEDNRKFSPIPYQVTQSGVDSTSPVKLLVVEDSDNERGLMTLVLASYGFVVHVARDGAEAHEQLKQWSVLPDVILMDMQMPLFNGLEALLRIREDQRLRDLIVYAVTGSRRVLEDEPSGRSWDRWFAKPIDMQSLVAAINADTEAKRAELAVMNRQGVEPCPLL